MPLEIAEFSISFFPGKNAERPPTKSISLALPPPETAPCCSLILFLISGSFRASLAVIVPPPYLGSFVSSLILPTTPLYLLAAPPTFPRIARANAVGFGMLLSIARSSEELSLLYPSFFNTLGLLTLIERSLAKSITLSVPCSGLKKNAAAEPSLTRILPPLAYR